MADADLPPATSKVRLVMLERYREVARQMAAGVSVTELARMLDVTHSAIYGMSAAPSPAGLRSATP